MFNRLPSKSMRAFSASAAMRGSSITTMPSRTATLPLSSGSATLPLAVTSMVDSPSARTREVRSEIAAMLRLPSTSRFNGRAPVNPTLPVATRVPTEPASENSSTVIRPLFTASVDGVRCSSVRPLKPTRRSRNATRPWASRQSGRRA
jgi:hypothetical protein